LGVEVFCRLAPGSFPVSPGFPEKSRAGLPAAPVVSCPDAVAGAAAQENQEANCTRLWQYRLVSDQNVFAWPEQIQFG
jgi:hypothetical protein